MLDGHELSANLAPNRALTTPWICLYSVLAGVRWISVLILRTLAHRAAGTNFSAFRTVSRSISLSGCNRKETFGPSPQFACGHDRSFLCVSGTRKSLPDPVGGSGKLFSDLRLDDLFATLRFCETRATESSIGPCRLEHGHRNELQASAPV